MDIFIKQLTIQNFLLTRKHTQQIEDLWRIIKSKYNIKKNGASPLLDRQLQEEWWRSYQNPKTIFDNFLTDMKNTFYNNID